MITLHTANNTGIDYRQLLNAAKYQLDEPGRKYHNWDHTLRVHKACRDILGEDGIDESLFLAAFFHDVIYVPGADENEEQSCEHLEWSLRRLGYLSPGPNSLAPYVERAQRLIMCTKVYQHLSPSFYSDDPLSYVLLDADLEGFAEPDYEKFAQTQIRIIEERGFQATHENRTKSSEFLKKFLEKPHIYHTKYARDNWEARARHNIETWAQESVG